jgi:hypothetical protein
MKLLEPLSFNTMRPAWRFEPGGIIWRVVPAGVELLLGEARATPTKEVSFFCTDLSSGTPLWDRREFGFGWWTGIEAVVDGVALIHGFASPDMPQHRGLVAVDLRSGREIWSRPDARFLGTSGGLLVVDSGAGELALRLDLDLRTGYIRRSRPSAGAPTRAELDDPMEQNAAQFPRPMNDPDGVDAAVAALVGDHCPSSDLAAPPEVLEAGGMIVFSYHEVLGAGARTSRNVLKVLDAHRRKVLFEEVLDAEVGSPAPESFFLLDARVIYVRERRVLTALRVF